MWPKFSDICLAVEGKTPKNLNQKIDPTGDRTWAPCVKSNYVTPRPQRWSSFASKSVLYTLSHRCANHATEGETLQSPFHFCDVTKPPYLFSGELCTSSSHCKRLFVYTVCCRRAVIASLCSEYVNQTSY